MQDFQTEILPSEQIRPHGVLLAGGQGRRMGGGDKPLRLLHGRTLLSRVIGRIAPQTASLCLSANGDPVRFAAYGLPVLADATADQGPLAGMLAGLRWARGRGAGLLLSVPADAPFLPADLAGRLAAALAVTGRSIAYAEDGIRPHPTVALIRTDEAEGLERSLAAGTRRIGEWMRGRDALAVRFADAACFANINTPEELAAAEARA